MWTRDLLCAGLLQGQRSVTCEGPGLAFGDEGCSVSLGDRVLARKACKSGLSANLSSKSPIMKLRRDPR